MKGATGGTPISVQVSHTRYHRRHPHICIPNQSVEDFQPRIVMEQGAQGDCVTMYGSWNAAILAQPENWLGISESLQRQAQSAMEISWDLRQIERLDHTGAQMLWNAWGQRWPKHVLLLEVQRVTLSRVERFTVQAPVAVRKTWREWYLGLGAWVLVVLNHVADGVALLGQLLLDLWRFAQRPAQAPWRDISSHLYRIGVTALPITALVGFLIGVVLAYLLAQQLRQFGADAYIVNILGMALIRELGPVLAAILIAGRSGSAMTAQIGVMRVTEELDAMQVMGIRQGYRLVMPRVLAMALAMPLLAAWTTAAALLGGLLAADLTMGLTPAYFFTALPKVVPFANLWFAMLKSTVFGLLIALIGCHFGLRVRPDTQSLGQGTTASVVISITTVILMDALFAVLFKGVGL